MLTPRQEQTLSFIKTYQRSNGGVSPRLEDIAASLRLKSKASVHRLLVGLEERGFIRRPYYKNRAIEVLERTTIKQMRAAWFRFDDEVQELVPFKGRQ
jgi:repressor LexA